MITIEEAQSVADLLAVLNIQQANKAALSRMYSLDLLSRINEVVPIVIAKDGQNVVGYCVTMLRQYTGKVPELADHFHQVDSLTYNGTSYIFENKRFKDLPYVMEDQICIDASYRRQRIPKQMYKYLGAKYKELFPLMVTGIRKTNSNSLKSHLSSKFTEIADIPGSAPESNWVIMISEWHVLDT